MSDFPESVMIFAAGFGSRMGRLTRTRPKPLIQVAGRALIDHTLALVDAIRPVRVVANVHYHAAQLTDHLAPKGVALSQEEEILETGGGLRAALPLLGNGPVYTANPDVIWLGPNPLLLLRQAWDPDQMDALLMCIPVERAIGHTGSGDFDATGDGQIRRGSTLVYGGVQILKTGGLAGIGDSVFSLNLLWDRMAGENRLYCANYPGKWCDVGRPEGIALAEDMLLETDV